MACFKTLFTVFLILILGCKKHNNSSEFHFVSLTNVASRAIQDNLEELEITLNFDLAPGYHIQPEALKESDFISTRFTVLDSTSVKVSNIRFIYDTKYWTFDEETYFEVISKSFAIVFKLDRVSNSKTADTIEAVLRYQACDDRKCYFPRELNIMIPLSAESKEKTIF